MNYKVCILTAGVGGRMGGLSDHINKGILPVNFKAVLSHIIEKFPEEIEIVIAVGHKKETVQDYLAIAHPERKIIFVEIDKYVGHGTGPGYSLLQCRRYLNCPFIFTTSDTLLIEKIPEPIENFMAIAPFKGESERYCTVKIKNNLIYQIDDKIKTDNKFLFTGVAGVKDYDAFFDALEKNKELKSGEIQVSNGFISLIEKKLLPVPVTWFDTGALESYKETNQSFSGGNVKFDFSKTNEFIYNVNGRIIKYFADGEISRKRVERARLLKGLVPEIESQKGNFYSYKKVDGQVLYNLLNRQIVRDFFQWLKQNLWKKREMNKDFADACLKFYQDKTIKRLEEFYRKTGIEDIQTEINGVQVPPLKDLLKRIDWNSLIGIPTQIHGDNQFDNVLVTTDPKSNLQKFVLLDWRQDFGGLDYGDLYYDLAKLLGCMDLPYNLIKNGEFHFDMSGNSIYYNYSIKNDLIGAKEEFEEFVKKNGFDMHKIKLIEALIFFNMSPLHSDPFDLMLYFLGKSKLFFALNQERI